MKKVIALFLLVNMILVGVYTAPFAEEYRDKFYIEYGGQVYHYSSKLVSLVIDGKPIKTGEMPAVIINDSTLVPVREVFESDSINAKVVWNGTKQEVNITYKDKVIVLKIGSKIATVNGKQIELDVPADLIRDMSQTNPKTMVPLRFISEKLGYQVQWDQQTYTANISTPTPDSSEQVTGENSAQAKMPLPTALLYNPIVWNSISSDQPITTVPTTIEDQNNPEVKVTSVKYDEAKGNFNIVASGPISSVVTSTLPGKYIVDIHGANYGLDSGSTYKCTYDHNPVVLSVRSSQQDPDAAGNKVLRIVFDLINSTANYEMLMSQDRKTLSFHMVEGNLQYVSLGQNEVGDYIELKGNFSADLKVFRLSNPNRIVLDLPSTFTQLGYKEQADTKGQYIKSIRTNQFDTTTARVVVETDGQPDYTITKIDSQTILVQFLEPSYDNINYQNEEHPTITLEGANEIPLELITYEDQYYNKKYIIHLPGDYESIFGKGGIQVDDSHISSIEIQKNTITGYTDLVINENDINVFRIESDSNNVYIKAYKPKEVYSKILLLDFGHGGKDPGAVGIGGLKEKNLNLTIGLLTKAYLDADPSIKVYYTRTGDTYPELKDRTDLANAVEADFFISIHNNAMASSYTGTETLYRKDTNRPGLNSSELAQIMHRHVLEALGLPNRGLKPRDDLFVLNKTNMPAVILEEGFVTSPIDMIKLTDPIFQDKIARGIYEGIVETFAEYPTGR